METNKEKKQTSWEFINGKFYATMPLGMKVTIDVWELLEQSQWELLGENVRFVILYGIKQIVSDRANNEDTEQARKDKMLATFKRIVSNDLSRTSGIKQTATKKLASVKDILASDMTAEEKNKAIMALIS